MLIVKGASKGSALLRWIRAYLQKEGIEKRRLQLV
jgi:hypothetical protein